MRHFLPLLILAVTPALAATYFVDGPSPKASDKGPGTEAAPWKTLAFAGQAPILKPGDTVLIKSGVYREHMAIKVSGEPGKPITFAAAPGAIVVIKGSELVKGEWKRLKDAPEAKEPFPNAYSEIWKITLDERFFTDLDFKGCYDDKSKRWVSQVILEDRQCLQRIGPDPIYKNAEYTMLTTVGRGLDDMIENSFFFDPATQTLYVKIGGEPGWSSIEVGVRGWTVTADQVHDVVIRGLQMRQNRQPGGQWPMASVGRCERVTVEDCSIRQSDFAGLGFGQNKSSVVRNCDLSYNGNTGLGMGQCEDCTIEDCTLMYNNYRRFSPGWHCGGMKCIPANKRCTIQRCESAYNVWSPGIWFDADNEDIRILDNVTHHNGTDGIFFEINGHATPDSRGGLIAGNLSYANTGRGIYISGSQRVSVVHNTVAGNDGGIVVMPREGKFTVEHDRVLNNLLLDNYVRADTITRGCDLILFMDAPGQEWDPGKRRLMTSHSDYNTYSNTSWVPFMRHTWNPNNTIDEWRKRFGEDMNSRLLPVTFEMKSMGFRLLTTTGLDTAGPLPADVNWTPKDPKRVGSSRTMFP